jgi:iron complex outermembrane receptor protein
MQELELGALRLEGGLRYERTSITSQAVGFDRSFGLWSVALGGFLKLSPQVRVGLSLSSTARAPAAEELLADGPHVGTQSYEIGNPGFGRERARSAELMLRSDGDGWRFDLAAYYNRFSGYIYEFQTGAVIDDLPVFQFAQAPARYWGLEAEGEVTLWRGDSSRLTLDALGDLVRARIDNFGAAPRIPPWRARLGSQLESGDWTIRLEAERSAAQRRVTAFETATPGFTLVNASIGWDIPGKVPLTLAVSANNIGDVTARRHASFLKDFAPLAGRDIRLSLRLAL